MEHWSINWNQFMAVLGATALIVSILSWLGRLLNNKYNKQRDYSTTVLTFQTDINSIKTTIAEIKAKLDSNNATVVGLAQEIALQGASLKAAWKEIDKIQENCKEIQNDKRKERLS